MRQRVYQIPIVVKKITLDNGIIVYEAKSSGFNSGSHYNSDDAVKQLTQHFCTLSQIELILETTDRTGFSFTRLSNGSCHNHVIRNHFDRTRIEIVQTFTFNFVRTEY